MGPIGPDPFTPLFHHYPQPGMWSACFKRWTGLVYLSHSLPSLAIKAQIELKVCLPPEKKRGSYVGFQLHASMGFLPGVWCRPEPDTPTGSSQHPSHSRVTKVRSRIPLA